MLRILALFKSFVSVGVQFILRGNAVPIVDKLPERTGTAFPL